MIAPNPYAKQVETYRKNQIETASKEEILILLYEGAIRFLLIAEKAHQNNDVEKYNKNIIKTQHIIREFMDSLDMEIGGEVALNLYRLYDYLHYRLVQANIKKDVSMIEEVLDHLRKLKSTWEEAILLTQQKEAPAHVTESA